MVSNSKFMMDYILGISDAKDSNGNKYRYSINEKALFYKLENDNYLVIRIKATDNKKVEEEQIKQLTNFDISVK